MYTEEAHVTKPDCWLWMAR